MTAKSKADEVKEALTQDLTTVAAAKPEEMEAEAGGMSAQEFFEDAGKGLVEGALDIGEAIFGGGD